MAYLQQVTIRLPRRQRAGRRLSRLVHVWWRRIEDRRALADMDDRSLRDFGATRYDAFAEIRKPFWRA